MAKNPKLTPTEIIDLVPQMYAAMEEMELCLDRIATEADADATDYEVIRMLKSIARNADIAITKYQKRIDQYKKQKRKGIS